MAMDKKALRKWLALIVGAVVLFLLMAFATPVMMGEKIDKVWVVMSGIGAVVGVVVGNYLETKLPRRRKRRNWLPISRPVQRFLAAAIVGAAAVVIAQPWAPDGWPWWRTAVFTGFCFFGMWGGLALRDWAYKKQGGPESDSKNW